ncbi:MAG: hypothetical protein U0J62_09920 [Lachnospiraceae bacterium]|nr:hypothetical protein [Lachnospiraceae bacterium]
MSKYSEYIKSRKEKDLEFFFGEVTKKSNKYFEYNSIIDEDNIIIITNNIKTIKGNMVMIVDNNKAVYLKDWQVRRVHNFYNGVSAFAVKLNRKYFKPYTFRFDFEDMAFKQEETFDSLKECAAEQDYPIALGA